MIKPDLWITKMAEQGMITPFVPSLVRVAEDSRPVISYGLSSYGYDIRLSSAEFRVFRHIPGTVVDPKRFSERNLEAVQLHSDEQGDYFILPAHSYGLGVAVERLEVPDNVTVICIGKSTYARAGLIANLTPAEAGWRAISPWNFPIPPALIAGFMPTKAWCNCCSSRANPAKPATRRDGVSTKTRKNG